VSPHVEPHDGRHRTVLPSEQQLTGLRMAMMMMMMMMLKAELAGERIPSSKLTLLFTLTLLCFFVSGRCLGRGGMERLKLPATMTQMDSSLNVNFNVNDHQNRIVILKITAFLQTTSHHTTERTISLTFAREPGESLVGTSTEGGRLPGAV